MIKAEFINLGRNNVNRIVEVKDTKALHKEIDKHILFPGWGMDESDDPDLYFVYSGWNIVGSVRILSDNTQSK